MSFRARLITVVMVMSVLMLGGTFAIIQLAVHASELRQLDAALLAEAWEETADLVRENRGGLRIGAGPGPLVDDTGPLTKYVVLYDGAGDVLDHTDNLGERPPPLGDLPGSVGEPFNLVFRGQRLRAVTVRVRDTNAKLLLAAPRTFLDADQAFLVRTMAVVLAGAIVFSMIVTSWLMRRLTRDHEAIARAVRNVTAGDLTARAMVPASAGESARLAADVNHMIERIASLLDSQRRFIAHASHELRSPLTLLYGELSHALRRSRDTESYRRAIEEARHSTQGLMRLTDHLLALARLEARDLPRVEPIELAELVARAADEARRSLPESTASLCMALEPTWVHGQPTDLERLVHNLVRNALRHAESGVVVELDQQNGLACIAVRDDGPGVPVAERLRIFEPFYRSSVDRARDEEGTGLGLTLVQEIVRTHGGHVRVEDVDPRGARFVVELPLGSPNTKEEAEPTPVEAAASDRPVVG